jgi:hypothetical protein
MVLLGVVIGSTFVWKLGTNTLCNHILIFKIGEILVIDEPYDWSSFFSFDIYQFIGGVCLVGLVGVAQLVFLLDFRASLFLGRSSGRNSLELIILGIMVLIGLFKAFWFLYKVVENQTQKLLIKAENMIMEVQ